MLPSAPPQPPAERRALTIMFGDLVGSTALSARLDPEDLRDVLTAYQRRATEIVEAAGGRIARYEGDGVLAYFGYPTASEEDAERAVRAGLELAHRIGTEVTAGERLSVRVGIASGVVVVGELLRSDAADNPPVVGETPNVAARLQALAEPGGVVIADSTRRLTGGMFEYRDAGARLLEGLAGPVRVWHVLGARGAIRFTALRSPWLPLLGRDAAMATLREEWAAAETGGARTVLVSGEAGIGKSRLALELVGHVRRRRATVLRFQCSPHHQSSLLYPLLERLQRATRRQRPARAAGGRTDEPVNGPGRLRALLRGSGPATEAAAALLWELMSMPAAARADAPHADAQRTRALLLEALVASLQRLAQERPLLLLLEDAHWIDPTSQQLLDLIVERLQTGTERGQAARGHASEPRDGMREGSDAARETLTRTRLLLVVTCRPEYKPDWRSRAAHIELRPLAPADAEALVGHIPGGERLAQAVAHGIAARADGVPLFVEELTKAVVEASQAGSVPRTGSPAAPAIPSTLQASLMARLDHIGEARETAKVAAALGREFSFDLLSAVVPDRDAGTLRREMDALAAADLVVPVAPPPRDTHAFRHVLIQDAAYGTLLRAERRALHERIARAIQARFPEIAATEPEVVADHFTKAELWEAAARSWLDAGRRAVRGWALVEAAKHLTEGIRIAGLLSPSPARERLELELNLELGPVMMGASGYASEASLDVFRRAAPLVKAVGSVSEHLLTVLGLFNVHYGRAELAEALALAQEYHTLADLHGVDRGRAHVLLGQSHVAMGAFAEAALEFERSLVVFAAAPENAARLDIFGSQQVVSLAFAAGAYYALGRAEEGRAALAQSIARARQMEHPLSIALALVTDLLTPIPGGLDPDPARAEAAVRFCAEHRLRNFQVWAEFGRGAILARRGDPRSGIAAMRAAIDTAEAMCSRLFRPTQLGTLAAAHARLGEIDKALALLDEALATSARTGETRAEASLYRLRGELLIAAGRRRRGLEALQRSLRVARSQQGTADEARTATVIARLQQAHSGRRAAWSGPLTVLRAVLARLAAR
jgi:class 3 adenylate cyclase/tetratricopeptide (TPR) repeat protein